MFKVEGLKSKDELAKLDDNALLDYFLDQCGYYWDAPENSLYSIPLGNRILFSSDTVELKAKFFKAVRKGSKRKLSNE